MNVGDLRFSRRILEGSNLQSWRVLENRALRKISGPKGEKETGDRRKLHSEGLCNLCFS